MESIVTQIALKMGKKICEIVFEKEWTDLGDLASQIEESCLACGRDILCECLKEINKGLREDEEYRKRKGLNIKEHDRPRTVYVKGLGDIRFKRDYYCYKETGGMIFPLDRMLGLDSYERVEKNLKAQLACCAAKESYQKSTEHLTGGDLSRQTVRNAVLKCKGDLEIEVKPEKRVVKQLHLFADEDHVHLQKPGKVKGKQNQFVPLITVTEGTQSVSQGRNETINPVAFVDKDFDTARLWKAVEGYLVKQYDMEKVEAIYIHGDGAPWIQGGLSNYPNRYHVMDGFHVEQELDKMDRAFPKRTVSYRIRQTFRTDDQEKAINILESLEQNAGEKELKVLYGFRGYIQHFWDAIVLRYRGDLPGSWTEGMVSHTLSERFSMAPMGWSKEGLGKLSKLRVYCINGGKVEASIFGEQENPTLFADYYEDYLCARIYEKLDWSIFEKQLPIFDGNSGTQRLIQMIGRIG